MEIILTIPTAEEMKKQTAPMRERLRQEEKERNEHILQASKIPLIAMWEEIKKKLKNPKQNDFIELEVFPSHYLDTKEIYRIEIIDKSIEQLISSLCKAGYKVETHYYSKSWYWQSGKYVLLSIRWV